MLKHSRIAKTIMLLLIFSSTPSFSETHVGFAGEKVDLNAATLEELDTLPHVGKYTAQRIIELRPITKFDALLSIKGMTAEKVEDLKQLATLGNEKDSNSFEITMAGAPVKVTRIGDGPQGVIIFGHSGSKQMAEYLKANAAGMGDLLPSKISLFLFAYPSQTPPFDQVDSIIEDFTRNNNKSAFLAFPGVASSVVEQVREASGLHQFLIIANSLGAGIVLQDYSALAADKSVSFLLISPTAAFMPRADTIPPLQRTSLIGATGEDYADDGHYSSQDRFLEGKEGQPGSEKWEWFRQNANLEWCELITQSGANEPNKMVGNLNLGKPNDFTGGHKTIGAEIDAELLAKLIRVKLGWSDKTILAVPPKQR